MKAPTLRRAPLASTVVAPNAVSPVAESLGGIPMPPSDLAQSCEWAAAYWHEMGVIALTEGWDDRRWRSERARYDAIIHRASVEEALSLTQLRAKTHLALVDIQAERCSFLDPEFNDDLKPTDRLILSVLRDLLVLTEGAR